MSDRSRRSNFQRRSDNTKKISPRNQSEDQSVVEKTFYSYQEELDARHDKYERLVKKSRDLTIESKRIIFLLHRLTSERNEDVLKEAEDRLGSLTADVISIICSELTKREIYQFNRAFSPGLQEYVEAVSFYHYLKYGRLISLDEVCHSDFGVQSMTEVVAVENNEPEKLSLAGILNPLDFILGIGDLTGELMRKCINSVSSGNMEEPFELCSVLQRIYESFLFCKNTPKYLNTKIWTLKCSLQKVENACYAIKIRGSEMPKHMLVDFFSTDDDYKGNLIDGGGDM